MADMLLLTATDLTRQFGTEPVFAGLTFAVHGTERIGLVGLLQVGDGRARVAAVERHVPDQIRKELHLLRIGAAIENRFRGRNVAIGL